MVRRRGWEFEVALVTTPRAPTEGANPLVRSPRGEYFPRDPPLFESHPLYLQAHLLVWRRGWDSNPRSRCRDACFPSMSIRPLSHLSASAHSKKRHLNMRPRERQGEQTLSYYLTSGRWRSAHAQTPYLFATVRGGHRPRKTRHGRDRLRDRVVFITSDRPTKAVSAAVDGS